MTAEQALAIATPLAVIIAAIITQIKAAKVAVKMEDVKTTLAINSKNQDQKLDNIHILVNSNMAAQLRISAVALRRLASLPSSTEEDHRIADEAERLYDEHQKKQALVDGQGKV